jgi:hypothetical protein
VHCAPPPHVILGDGLPMIETKSLIVSNGIFLCQRTLPPWTGTPTGRYVFKCVTTGNLGKSAASPKRMHWRA